MIDLGQITRENDIQNLLSQYTKSKLVVSKVLNSINSRLSKLPGIEDLEMYSVTLLRKQDSISIWVEVFRNDKKRIGSVLQQISHETLSLTIY